MIELPNLFTVTWMKVYMVWNRASGLSEDAFLADLVGVLAD
jgi:hypothetical protein